MEPKAPFSRLQLAAALIEYDNDDEDPTKHRRSAHESAIFAHLRRTNPPHRPSSSRKSADYLSIVLPSEGGSNGNRDSVIVGNRRSRAGSVDALQNPFGRDSTYEGGPGEDEEGEMEVDLTSWGLDAFIETDKDQEPKSRHPKSKPGALPNPHSQFASQRPQQKPQHGRRPGTRAMSLGYIDAFGEGGAFLDAKSSADNSNVRRHSIGSPLDLPTMRASELAIPRRPASVHALIENLPVTLPLHSVPFPTSESVRSGSPLTPDGAPRPSSRSSLLNPSSHGRTYSAASLGSKMALNEEAPNPFALRSPSPDRVSRFDPKACSTSGTTHEEPNPFALRPPSPSRSSRFDPKAVRARTVSNGSLGTQMLLDNDAGSSDGDRQPRQRLYSRMELMRPKLLIMPSPLQGTTPQTQPSTQAREGFEMNTDGPPLPPGARTAPRSSAALSMLFPPSSAPIASNSFTPNPRQSLSLSQLTFRNTLVVDGQRDVAYTDIDNTLRRATEDGDQIEPDAEEDPTTPVAATFVDNDERSKRPPGRLFGKSLIDDLEARKADMQSKRRVFTGDQRPSMMARTPMHRSSTLIDPESLQRPISQRIDSFKSQPELSRRNSTMKPLINFDNEFPGAPHSARLGVPSMHPADKRSVFGVDTLWERELAKLREIEERERQEAEEQKKRGAEDDKRKKKGKKKGKHKAQEMEQLSATPSLQPESAPPPRPGSPSYVLPMIEKTSALKKAPPPPPLEDETEEDSDSSELPAAAQSGERDAEAAEWLAGSSDEEDKRPRRTTGSGPRYPNQPPRLVLAHRPDDDESSEEDLPLVATIGRAAQRVTRAMEDESSDEEKPLSTLLDKTKLKLPSMGESLFPEVDGRGGDDEDEDDNKPLGLRLPANSPNPLSSASQDADDDRPLGLHPEQMRRTQYMMAAQQQQQMMMYQQAAQLHQSMIFGAPSMMSSGFFGPPIPPPMMMPPQVPATPPSIPDSAKFGRVDKWRHDVAVEGEP